MKSKVNVGLFFCFFIFRNIAWGQLPFCDKSSGVLKDIPLSPELVSGIKDYAMDSSNCENLTSSEASKKEFDKAVKRDRDNGEKIVKVSSEPTFRNSNSVGYTFQNQILKPGESMYIRIPSDLAKKGISFVIVGHRQNPATDRGRTPGVKMDKIPGLTSVQLYDPNRAENERWRYWGGPSSGSNGAKFAEAGRHFELEGLYQWSKYGHIPIDGKGSISFDELNSSMGRLVNLGEDPVEISEFTIKVNPPKADEFVEHIFTKGTKFGDIVTGDGYKNGGGQITGGIFKDALVLNGYSNKAPSLPANWKYKNGRLIIPLPQGKILTGVELNVGDSHPDGVKNSDGGTGTKGWSRLSVYKTDQSGKMTETLMQNENVPPEGVLNTGPKKCGHVIGPGEVLVVEGKGRVYLAGIRYGLKEP